MDNDPVKPSRDNDEEYQFTDDEGAHKYESPAAASSPLMESRDSSASRRKKLILIIIGVIVGVFCLYKLYGLFTVAPSKTPLEPTQTQVQKPVVEQVNLPQPQSQPIQPAQLNQQPVLSEEKFDKEGIKDKVSSLEQAVVKNTQTQENLQGQIGGVSSAIAEIQSNIATLTQQLNAIAQQNQEKEKAEAAHKAELAKQIVKKSSYDNKNRGKNKKLNYTGYYVKAMIQGRAWLVSSSGATFTISTGDQLSGYGQIREIDPDKGIVMTSSGRVISYMPRDR